MQPFYLLSEYAASKPKCRESIASCSEVELVVTTRALRYASPAPLRRRSGPARPNPDPQSLHPCTNCNHARPADRSRITATSDFAWPPHRTSPRSAIPDSSKLVIALIQPCRHRDGGVRRGEVTTATDLSAFLLFCCSGA